MKRSLAIKILPLGLAVIGAFLSVGCSHNIDFSNRDLKDTVEVTSTQNYQDSFGILHVTINVRNKTDSDVYIDGFVTFMRNGKFVEKLGPKQIILRNGLPDVIQFNSTQPADNFQVSFDNSK